MKGELDNTAKLGPCGVGKTLPPRKAVLRPEDPIGNTGHGRERPEELKVRIPSSKSHKLGNKYAHRKATKLHNKIEETLLQRDISRAILSNLEGGMKDLETRNLGFVDTQHSEHAVYSMDEQQSSEGEEHDLPLPPSWKSTVPQ